MASRLDLQTKLEEVLGSRHVYFQPPATVKIEYPAIIYHRETIDSMYADDLPYLNNRRYQLILIDRKPDTDYIDKLLELPMCSHDRFYTADNLNHDVFTIYW